MEQQLIVGRYRPLEDLGEGAFGTVVLSWDTRMQRRVAIKRLPLPLDADGTPLRPHGLAEARTAAMLNHPGIVTVFDFDSDSDEAFLVMEYVDGAPLADLLDHADGPLTSDEAASVLADVADALEFAHENGVLHLDVKPENVLVQRDGRAKVADFGIAELSTLAGHGPAYGGTFGYMPLEQLEGATVNERTDEWALAALAFELLTGVNPFVASDHDEAAERLETGPPRLADFDVDVAPGAGEVLERALALRNSERYESVALLADDLLPLLGDSRAGRRSLTELVADYLDEDESASTEGAERIGLWDRMQGRLGPALGRIVAAAEAGWLAWAGLAPFALERPAYAAGVGLVALAGLLAPGLGIGLGIGCFVVGLAVAGSWELAVALLGIGGVWWWFIARHDHAAAILPLSAPVLATVRLAFLQPLLAGFMLPPLQAALTALLGGTLTMLASAASAHGAPYLSVWPGYAFDVWDTGLAAANLRALVTSPAALMALLGWPAAAAVMSVMCRRATRLAALLGGTFATAVLGLAYLLAEQISQTMGTSGAYQVQLLGVSLGASLILVTLIASLGAPLRTEEEPPFALARPGREDD